MAKIKAIIITNRPRAYTDFIRMNQLNIVDYPQVSDKFDLYGYKDTIALLITGWGDVFGYGMELNHTEAVLKNHNVDTFRV